jgi:hypothetical protein
MLAEVLLRPARHGAVGPLDEILTLLPLVIGVVLLLYLYFSARRSKPSAGDPPPAADAASDDDSADL